MEPTSSDMNRPLAAIIIVIILFLGAVAFWHWHSRPAPVPASAAPQVETFAQTYVTGFEGENYDVSYSLSYPADEFTVHNDGDNKTLILLDDKKTGAESSIKIFWNGAAGVESPEQYWDMIRPCPECSGTSTDAHMSSDAQTFTYTDATDEWTIRTHAPDFYIVTHFPKPSDDARAVWATFRLDAAPDASNTMPPGDVNATSSSKTTPPGEAPPPAV